MNLKDHQVRIVTGACLLSNEKESAIAEYCSTPKHRLSCHTHPVVGLRRIR